MSRPLLVVQHEADDPPGRLGDWLTAAGATLDVRSPFAGEALPNDLSGHAGLVVLGGGMGAHDDIVAPWLPDVRALLARAVREQVPTLAICLGAQLLAVVTGGQVVRGPDGPELGAHLVAKRTTAAADPLLRSLPITPDVLQWHHDAITRLPPGAVLLASSPLYEVQAFRMGRVVWGFQFHIETSPELVRRWAGTDPEVADYDLTRLLERSDAAHPDIAEAWAPVAAAFVEVSTDPGAVSVPATPTVVTAQPVDDPAAIRAALAGEMQASRGPLPLGMPGRAPTSGAPSSNPSPFNASPSNASPSNADGPDGSERR